MGVLNLTPLPASVGQRGEGGQMLSALAQLLLSNKLTGDREEAKRQAETSEIEQAASDVEGFLPQNKGKSRTLESILKPEGYDTTPELIRRPEEQLPKTTGPNPDWTRIPRTKASVEKASELSLKQMLGMEDEPSSHLVMPSKQSVTGYGHFGGKGFTKYIGPAPIPYGSENQPGMGQYVGPQEDDPSKGNIFIPTRGGGKMSTISTPGRTSKKTLDSMPANSKTSLASARIAYKGITEAGNIYNEALKGQTGPIEGRAKSAYATIANSPKVAELKQKLGRTLASVLRAESGLVVTDTEREFYQDTLLPMMKNPDANFETLLRETKKWIQDIHDSNVDILRESNTESPKKLSEMSNEGTGQTTGSIEPDVIYKNGQYISNPNKRR